MSTHFFAYSMDPQGIIQVVGLGLGCVSAICLYGRYRSTHPDYHDPLMRKIGISDLDGWSLTHYGFYTLYGYYFPKYWWCAFLCGCAWEGFEHWYGSSRPGFLGGFGDFKSTDPNVGEWWHGRLSDPVINGVGILSGMTLKRILNN